MKKLSITQKICVFAGILLLIVAGVVTFLWQRNLTLSRQQNQIYVQTLRQLIPEPRGAALESRSDNTMPVLSLDGTDFVGILEMPRYGSALPVCGDWGNLSQYPCRFSGSVYDGSLRIGSTSQPGHYDFFKEISVGDSVYFTDLAGNQYAYTVTDLRYAKHADEAAFQRADGQLTLFIKNVYAFEYLMVFCNTAS